MLGEFSTGILVQYNTSSNTICCGLFSALLRAQLTLLYYIEELTRMACENYMNDEAQD